MKNLNISDLDTAQIIKRTVDASREAIRIVNAVDDEISIAISAEENDSVQSVARYRVISSEDGAVECGTYRKCCNFGQGTVSISADNVTFIDLNLTLSQGSSFDICAAFIKVSSGKIVVRS